MQTPASAGLQVRYYALIFLQEIVLKTSFPPTTSAQRTIVHRVGITVSAAAVCVAVLSGPASAKDVDVVVDYSIIPTLYVESAGGTYTGLAPEKHTSPTIKFGARLQISGGQDRIRRWEIAPRMYARGKSWGWTFDTSRSADDGFGTVHKSYGSGDRPHNVDRYIDMNAHKNYVKSFAIDVCNANADELRASGKTNAFIFANDHDIPLKAGYKSQVTYTNLADTDSWQVHEAVPAPPKAKIVCMKSVPVRVPPPANLQIPLSVTQSSLTIVEKSTANGACKVHLSGVVETNLPNGQVRFRYEHTNGKKSDVKTVNTDHSKTAFFAYQYDIPNNPNGGEAGSIRIIGVSPQFESAWKTYDMECSAPAPGGFQAATIPEIKLAIGPGKTAMINGQICPTEIVLDAQVKADSAFSGKGIFWGDGFLTPLQEVDVSANQLKHVLGKRELNWNAGGGMVESIAQSGGKPPLKSQKVRIGFNLTNDQGKVVAQTPQDWYTVTCKEPQVNPGVQIGSGNFVNPPRDNSASNPPQRAIATPAPSRATGGK